MLTKEVGHSSPKEPTLQVSSHVQELSSHRQLLAPNGVIFEPQNQDFLMMQEILSPYREQLSAYHPYHSSEMETRENNPIGEEGRRSFIEALSSLPVDQGHRIFGLSRNLAYIQVNAANHRALERIYDGPDPALEVNQELLDWADLNIKCADNARAARNRYRLVVDTFTRAMEEALATTPEDERIDVLSIGAGSSRALMEGIKRLNGHNNKRIRMKLVDLSADAVHDGKELAAKIGLKVKDEKQSTDDYEVDCVKANAANTSEYLNSNFKPQFVEIVGLFDYFSDPVLYRTLREIRRYMPMGGKLLWSCIALNHEKAVGYTHGNVGWMDMEYRSLEDVLRLTEKAGFEPAKITPITEPLGLYNLALATK